MLNFAVMKCEWCNKTIEKPRRNKRFCSTSCRVAAHMAKAGHQCSVCKKRFSLDELSASWFTSLASGMYCAKHIPIPDAHDPASEHGIEHAKKIKILRRDGFGALERYLSNKKGNVLKRSPNV